LIESTKSRNTVQSKAMLTVAEAAHELGLQPSAIRAWLLRREIEFVRVGRRAIRIPFSAVAQVISNGRVPARPQR
jgi:excisionase family DNA binding protein